MNTSKKVLLLCGAAVLAAALTAGAVFGWKAHRRSQAMEEAGIWQAGGHWGEALDHGGDAANAKRFTDKLATLKNDYLSADNQVYCAVIPDKGFYLQNEGAPKADYEGLFATVQSGLAESGIQYIDLTAALNADRYYTTDSHWMQPELQPVMDALGSAMDFSADLSALTPNVSEHFAGAYGKYGAKAQDTLTWLTGPAIDSAVVEDFQHPEIKTVYDTARLTTDVPYDLFLSGATPLVTITSPEARTDKELVIFRDSFGSSIAPLFLEEYSKVTLVDIRYMVSALLPQYVEFTDQDVLFLYSARVVDQSKILR